MGLSVKFDNILYHFLSKSRLERYFLYLTVSIIIIFPALFVLFISRVDIRLIGIIITINVTSLVLILSIINSHFSFHQREKIYFESVGDGIFAIGTDYKIKLWNKAATLISGWEREEAIGRDFREVIRFVHERDGVPNIGFIEAALVHGVVAHMEGKTLLIKKDGVSKVSVSDSAAPILIGGKVKGIIVVFQDVSALRELERSKEEFAYLTAHQLASPLTAIQGYTDMLLDSKKLSKDQKSDLTEIGRASRILFNLISALLNISRVELGTLAVDPSPIDIRQAADEVIAEVLPRIKENKINFTKTYDPNLPSIIKIDHSITHAIIQNLLINAIKYTPSGGKVSLEIKKSDTKALIKVSDTGYGIPEDQQSKIFTKMFRADNVVSKIREGMGLGLYLVKKLVDEYGGEIWFESKENFGSTFYVTILLVGMKKKEGLKGLA